MKDDALELAFRSQDPIDRVNILREYVQACALRSLHESRAFEQLSFVGGTALRFLFDLPRYSEDLDFSLESPVDYEPQAWMAKIKRDLVRLGFPAEIAWNDRKIVQVAWIRIPTFLAEAGVVGRAEQKLSIKIKIDTSPPQGARMQKTMVNRRVIFALRHHDLPSLMAGKVHALMTRPYAKGRDWYDLIWYRSQRPPVVPNEELLKQALEQTGVKLEAKLKGPWQEAVARRAAGLDLAAVRADIEPFLERREDLALLTGENILGVLAH